ncbi:MAG: hypothetical protein AAFU69_07655, partial [Pseudomonadota bacterium]
WAVVCLTATVLVKELVFPVLDTYAKQRLVEQHITRLETEATQLEPQSQAFADHTHALSLDTATADSQIELTLSALRDRLERSGCPIEHYRTRPLVEVHERTIGRAIEAAATAPLPAIVNCVEALANATIPIRVRSFSLETTDDTERPDHRLEMLVSFEIWGITE